MNIAIIGYGSIGKRHKKNCSALGHNVDILSRHQNKKLTKNKYDLVIICSKTSEHLKDIENHINLSGSFLIEKPLAANVEDALYIKKLLSKKRVRVAYCLIYNPIISAVKDVILKKTIGNIYLAQIFAGSYLPNWRKGEDYKKRYSSKREEGGGVELDLIHEVNYTGYLFEDKIVSSYSHKDKVSNLKIDSNDLAFFAILQKKRLVTIILNYFQQNPERHIKFIGEKGSLNADLINKKMELTDNSGKEIYKREFDFDANQMYIDEIQSMERFIEGTENQNPYLSMNQAIKDLKIVEGKL